MLSTAELREKLKLSRADLDRLLKEGLPHERQGRARRFDPKQVRDWLLANEKAVAAQAAPLPASPPTHKIARTRSEVAHHFGVSERTVAEWLTDASFPGKSGNRGKRDGEFPLDEIRRWWDARRGTTLTAGEPQSARDRLNEVRARRAEIELDQLLGTLIVAEDVERFLTRTVSTAKAVLDQLVDQVLSCLPPSAKDDTRRRVRERVGQLLASAYATLAELTSAEDDGETSEAT